MSNHPYNIEYEDTWWRSLNSYQRMFRGTIAIMSVGPQGEAWLDEHAQGWREHVGLREVYAQCAIEESFILRPNPDDILKYIRSHLVVAVVQELLSHLEPEIREVQRDPHA